MARLEIENGWLLTRHGAFIRDASIDDQGLLKAVGIERRARRVTPENRQEQESYVYVSRDDQWLHVMDGQHGGLRRANLAGAVHGIGISGTEALWFDLAGQGPSLAHYHSGALVRRYYEEWTQLDGLVGKVEEGQALVGETGLRGINGGPWAIAEPLGIRGTHSWETLHVYALDGE